MQDADGRMQDAGWQPDTFTERLYLSCISHPATRNSHPASCNSHPATRNSHPATRILHSEIYFISGTDTGVGKTVVTALLALKLRQMGRSVGVCKPFASGCIARDGALESEDALYLKSILNLEESLAQINPITLREPLAPLVAARRANVSTAHWRQSSHAAIEHLKSRTDVVLVEGVGGLEVPIGEDPDGIWTARDFAADLDCPIVLVARRTLGTINHTLLSVKAAPNIKALVFNDAAPIDAGDVAAATGVELLREMTGLPVWGAIPFVGDARNDVAKMNAIAAREIVIGTPLASDFV